MIGIKDQCFGVEIELTGITRAEAAEALAAYFETTPQRSYDNYDSWYVPDREGKQWRIMSDGSIRAEWNDDGHYRRTTDPEYRVEMVTPKLTYDEMESFRSACAVSGRQAEKSTTPAGCTSMWMLPIITARVSRICSVSCIPRKICCSKP